MAESKPQEDPRKNKQVDGDRGLLDSRVQLADSPCRARDGVLLLVRLRVAPLRVLPHENFLLCKVALDLAEPELAKCG